MIEISLPVLVVTGFGMIVTWTSTVAICILWLSKQFTSLSKDIAERVSTSRYEEKHHEMEERLRQLELKEARRNGVYTTSAK